MNKMIAYIILFVINCILYWVKIQENKITFISYKSEKLEKDFKLIAKSLEKEGKYNFYDLANSIIVLDEFIMVVTSHNTFIKSHRMYNEKHPYF